MGSSMLVPPGDVYVHTGPFPGYVLGTDPDSQLLQLGEFNKWLGLLPCVTPSFVDAWQRVATCRGGGGGMEEGWVGGLLSGITIFNRNP